MTIELLIMRHAKSAWDTGHDDYDRPLNDRGTRDARRMAQWLAASELVPDRVITSAAARAQSTALAVVHECGIDRAVVDSDRTLYDASACTWMAALWRTPPRTQRLLICGHNPGFDDLVRYLSAQRPALTDSGKLMTTGAVAHLRFDLGWADLAARTGELVGLTRPREL